MMKAISDVSEGYGDDIIDGENRADDVEFG